MALQILATQADGATIEAATWNAEFNQIYNNPIDLISPVTSDITWNDNVKATFGTGGDVDIYYSSSNLVINPRVAGTGNILIDSGIIFIGDSVAANTKMTAGITLDQGAADNEILAFKSSDVDHAMTNETETDTFGVFKKASGANGGLAIIGFTDVSFGLDLQAIVETEQTTDVVASTGAIRLVAQKNSGGSAAAMGATGNVLTIHNGTESVLLMKGNGLLHVATAESTVPAGEKYYEALPLDAEDDVGLLRTYERLRSHNMGIIMSKWDEQIQANSDDLKRVGVLSSEGDFTCVQRMDSLLGGAIWQEHVQRLTWQEKMEKKLLVLENHG